MKQFNVWLDSGFNPHCQNLKTKTLCLHEGCVTLTPLITVHFSWMLKKKNGEKSLSVFAGAPFTPFKHTTPFFRKMFQILFSTFMKSAFYINSRFFAQKEERNKKIKYWTARSLKFSVTAKFCPMLEETPYFGGVINPKTYLKHNLSSKKNFLSSLAYKLVNIGGH